VRLWWIAACVVSVGMLAVVWGAPQAESQRGSFSSVYSNASLRAIGVVARRRSLCGRRAAFRVRWEDSAGTGDGIFCDGGRSSFVRWGARAIRGEKGFLGRMAGLGDSCGGRCTGSSDVLSRRFGWTKSR